jgi:hypothetical protein
MVRTPSAGQLQHSMLADRMLQQRLGEPIMESVADEATKHSVACGILARLHVNLSGSLRWDGRST